MAHSSIPIPAAVRNVVVASAKDEMNEDDKALAAMGYTPVLTKYEPKKPP